MRQGVILLLLLVIGGCATIVWVEAARNEEEGVRVFADIHSVRRTGDTARMRDTTTFKIPQVLEGQRYSSEVAVSEYDCRNRRWRGLEYAFYSDDLGQGEVVYADDGVRGSWSAVAPGSVPEALWKLACGRQ
jgi:hypothetical protein